MTVQIAPARPVLAGLPQGFLAGGWRQPVANRTFTVFDPATEAPIAEVADCAVVDAFEALAAADRAAGGWAATSPRERADVLHRLCGLLLRDRELLARVITAEGGRTLAETHAEVTYASDYLRWYAEEAVRPAGRSTPAPDGQSHIITLAEPVGVCLLIAPWNVPLAMAARKVAPALAAGCTVILKPAELTPLSSLVFGQLALEAGVPPGVVNVVPTSRPAELCRGLMEDPRLAKVSFTGSTSVGRMLLRQSGARVLRTSMELGGNAPFLVFDDADLDLAVAQAFVAKMRLAGQSCVAANRYLVQDGIADAFVAGLAERMAAVRLGPPDADGVELGPLIDARGWPKRSASSTMRFGAAP